MFGPCKGCKAKDAHIQSLEAQISFLKSLNTPDNDPNKIPIANIEANAILSGDTEIKELKDLRTAEEISVEEAIISERDRVLSGTY